MGNINQSKLETFSLIIAEETFSNIAKIPDFHDPNFTDSKQRS